MRFFAGTLVAFFLLALPQPQPASAGWIVLRGGEVIRTRGAWKVEGSSVVFTTMQKQYTSIRLAEVDVTASQRLNRQGSPRHAETFLQANRPRPVLVLINSKFAGQRRPPEKSRPVVAEKAAAANEAGAPKAEPPLHDTTPAGGR